VTVIVVNPATVPWQDGETEGLTFRCQVLLRGDDGGPEAVRFRFDPTPSVYAHMHLTSQFQLLLAGSMDMPRGKMDLRPLAVHYTDHCVPYGPFSVGRDHDMLVLHPKQGGLISMADQRARRAINLTGRLIVGASHTEEWRAIPGSGGATMKSLVPPELGPPVSVVRLPAGTGLALGPAPFGRYAVVLEGSVEADGQQLGPPGIRYDESTEPSPPLIAGPTGADVAVLTFDADALRGGLTGEGISLAAADAMAQAI
jgi:hypothetical protein